MVLLTADDDRETYHRPTPPIRHHNHHHNHPGMASSVDSRGGGSSSSLFNFTSLPCFNIKWGRQKQLRCVKYSDNNNHHQNEFSNSLTRSEFNSVKRRRSSSSDNDDGGIQAMREKLMLDFRRQAAQMQAAILNKSDVVSTVPPSPEVEPPPWNLRTRRAVCKGPTNNNNNNVSHSSERKPSFSPAKITDVKSPAKRNDVDISGGGGGGDEGQRAKFTRTLSKQEIEEDFLAIIGARPVRRPKKRPKIVQRQIDLITPGYWLSEITSDMYKVNDHP